MKIHESDIIEKLNFLKIKMEANYNLKSLNLEGTKWLELGTFAFKDCLSLKDIKLPTVKEDNKKIIIGLGCFVNTKYNI